MGAASNALALAGARSIALAGEYGNELTGTLACARGIPACTAGAPGKVALVAAQALPANPSTRITSSRGAMQGNFIAGSKLRMFKSVSSFPIRFRKNSAGG